MERNDEKFSFSTWDWKRWSYYSVEDLPMFLKSRVDSNVKRTQVLVRGTKILLFVWKVAQDLPLWTF